MERKYRYNFPAENKCDQNKSVIIIREGNKYNGCFNSSRKGMSCSLLDIVGGVCSAEEATSVFHNFQVLRQRLNLS